MPQAKPAPGSAYKVLVGFIQVCHNALRSEARGILWQNLIITIIIIKYVYESETAFFYFFQGCTLIDLVIPRRFKIDSKIEFVPVIVSTIIAPSYVVLLGIFFSKV